MSNPELNQHLDYLDRDMTSKLERLVQLQREKIMQLSLNLHKAKCNYNRLEGQYKDMITELQMVKE